MGGPWMGRVVLALAVVGLAGAMALPFAVMLPALALLPPPGTILAVACVAALVAATTRLGMACARAARPRGRSVAALLLAPLLLWSGETLPYAVGPALAASLAAILVATVAACQVLDDGW